jgi:hypothetical protein
MQPAAPSALPADIEAAEQMRNSDLQASAAAAAASRHKQKRSSPSKRFKAWLKKLMK